MHLARRAVFWCTPHRHLTGPAIHARLVGAKSSHELRRGNDRQPRPVEPDVGEYRGQLGRILNEFESQAQLVGSFCVLQNLERAASAADKVGQREARDPGRRRFIARGL